MAPGTNNGCEKNKYVFIFLSLLLLVYMTFLSREAGVNCDEVLHYNHSVSVLKYFSSHGKDTSALNTPVSHLKYYGQSYDNLATFLIQAFSIDDIYGFRHLMSTVAGWLTIVATALLAIWLAGFRSGIVVLLLFAISPTFLGHAQNNLKDIPFALAYISGIFFTFRFLFSGRRNSIWDIFLLTLSIAFSISIRPGGLMLICFLYLFLAWFYLSRSVREKSMVFSEGIKKLLIVTIISVSAYFLSSLFWPFALQDPIRNPIISYKVMLHFPDTFRQIFEGRNEWSDFMPWYYLPKTMAITIPLLVIIGFLFSLIFLKRNYKGEKQIFYVFLLVTVLLPVLFVVFSRSNLYSSWRHFLFIYPGIVILSAVTLAGIYESIKRRYKQIIFALAFIAAALDPFIFILDNPSYAYLYYNQIPGGLKGAYGNYETDYYFVSQKESAEWLLEYLREKKSNNSLVVGTNFSAEWFFRKDPGIKNIYFRNEERSMNDWDYYISTNRYITPWQLKNGIWPPQDALKVIYVDNAAVSAITERKTKADYLGYRAMEEGRNMEAAGFFEEAVRYNDTDEMIFYNFAVVLNRLGESERADTALARCLELNPDFEPALMYLGNLAAKAGKKEKAKDYYKRLISVNRKYYEAYEALEKLNE